MKRFLFALLLAPVFFSACKKDDDNIVGNEFVINGVHDITYNYSSTNQLPITLIHVSGSQQPVTLSVTGLPKGMMASISPANGTPDFASVITFQDTSDVVGGTYPIKIIGKSASFTRTIDLNLIVPVNYSFFIDGTPHNVGSLFRAGSFLRAESSDGNNYVTINFGNHSIPVTTTTYNIVENATASNEVSIWEFEDGFYDRSCTSTGADNKKLTVNVINGKISCSYSDVSASYTINGSNLTCKMSASLSE